MGSVKIYRYLRLPENFTSYIEPCEYQWLREGSNGNVSGDDNDSSSGDKQSNGDERSNDYEHAAVVMIVQQQQAQQWL